MKAQEREIYRLLAGLIQWPVCSFCKYLRGSGTLCDGGDSECYHPLIDSHTWPYCDNDPEPNDDCWGFRPSQDVSFFADIVGACLANDWDSAQWSKNDSGVWEVMGVNSEMLL